MSDLCTHCGAQSPRHCEWEEMTGMPNETAPCQDDGTWDDDEECENDYRARALLTKEPQT